MQPVSRQQYLLFPPARPLAERFGPEFFRDIPEAPGVYLMSTARDGVLYVGKAKNLRRRLGNYRSGTGERLPRKLIRLLLRVERIDWDLCPDEATALARERQLIRALQPRFNTQGVRPPKEWFIGWSRHKDCAVSVTGPDSRHALTPALSPGEREEHQTPVEVLGARRLQETRRPNDDLVPNAPPYSSRKERNDVPPSPAILAGEGRGEGPAAIHCQQTADCRVNETEKQNCHRATLTLALGESLKGWPNVRGPFVFARPAFTALLRSLWVQAHPGASIADLPHRLINGPVPARWTIPRSEPVARWLQALERFLDVAPFDLREPTTILSGAELPQADDALALVLEPLLLPAGSYPSSGLTAGLEACATSFHAQWRALDAECLADFWVAQRRRTA